LFIFDGFHEFNKMINPEKPN